MSNMNKRIRDMVYPLLVNKMGEQCTACGAGFFELKEAGKKPELFIDHIDNNNGNNSIMNMQLLCRSCNTKKNWSRNNNIEPTTRNAPLELQIGKSNMKKARKYVYGRMDAENYALLYNDLIDDMAEFLDCSQQAVRNYIGKMRSPKHGMFTLEDRNGDIYLVPKNNEELKSVVESV